jgi:protein-S-isoprenylcysteine O-methyltransferase Ste14
MMPETILAWMWAALGLYWFLSAWTTRKIEVNEVPSTRWLRLLIMCFVFTLLLTSRFRVGFLALRFVPGVSWIRDIGFGLTVAGLALCVWARLKLGEYWSDKVALKVEHQLIRSGPYARLRHPIYSGVLLAMAGTALAIGEWRGVVALAVMTVNYLIKARREDRILASHFGEQHSAYRNQAGFLVPKW